MEFPQEWPEDCPPDDSQDASGTFYRVGKSDPPAPGDFQSQAELGRAKDADNCLRVGLSIFAKLSDAKHLIRMNRRLGRFIYKGDLTEKHGKTKKTGKPSSSHMTWWPYAGVDRKAPFVIEKA
jgi:hypothetical protein